MCSCERAMVISHHSCVFFSVSFFGSCFCLVVFSYSGLLSVFCFILCYFFIIIKCLVFYFLFIWFFKLETDFHTIYSELDSLLLTLLRFSPTFPPAQYNIFSLSHKKQRIVATMFSYTRKYYINYKCLVSSSDFFFFTN